MAKQRVFLLPAEGVRLPCTVPHADAAYAQVQGACPACGCEDCKVAGTGRRPSKDDRAWEADAVALCCDQPVGVLRVETNTLFGVREDEAVLRGRWRVY